MSEHKSGAVSREYHVAVIEKKDRELSALKAQRDELLAALKRLGTAEAFTAYALGRKFDEESVARMEYACAAIANAEPARDSARCLNCASWNIQDSKCSEIICSSSTDPTQGEPK